MSEQPPDDVLEYLKVQHGDSDTLSSDASDVMMVIDMLSQGVERRIVFDTLQREHEWDVRRFARAAFWGRGFQKWHQDQQEIDGPSEIISSERTVEVNRLSQILADVADRDSQQLSDEERQGYARDSEQRWQLLFDALATKSGMPMHKISLAVVQGLMIDYAASAPRGPRPHNLPEGYREMYVSILLKYLNGAPPQAIRDAALDKDAAYKVTVQNVRTMFVNFAVLRLKPHSHEASPQPKMRRRSMNKGDRARITMVHAAHERRIKSEQTLRHQKSEVGPDLYAQRRSTVNRLGKALGGNEGAFRRIFNLPAEVIVEEVDIADARQRLWDALMSNIEKRSGLGGDEMITNEELVWMAPLCGMKLVPDVETKKLIPQTAEPCTMDEMKALVLYLENARADDGRPKRGATDIEQMMQATCNKLIYSKAA